MRGNLAERMKQAVYHSESETRRREFEQKRQERAEQERAEQEHRKWLETALLDASDAVWNAEQVLKREGPETPDEGFSERYMVAANNIELLRDYRDEIEYEVWKCQNGA